MLTVPRWCAATNSTTGTGHPSGQSIPTFVRLPDRLHDHVVVGADDKTAQARTARRPLQVRDRAPYRLGREVDPYREHPLTLQPSAVGRSPSRRLPTVDRVDRPGPDAM
jgi:hypothetical protein